MTKRGLLTLLIGIWGIVVGAFILLSSDSALAESPAGGEAIDPSVIKNIKNDPAEAVNPCNMKNPCTLKQRFGMKNPYGAKNPCGTKVKRIRKTPALDRDRLLSYGEKLWNDKKLSKKDQLSCATCHPGGTGLKKDPYPKYLDMPGDIVTLDQMINFCMKNPMKGKYLKWNSLEMTALAAYVSANSNEVRSANPCGINPCAVNPCGANPCAVNPCEANPCGANPCGANPCAVNPCNSCAANPCAPWIAPGKAPEAGNPCGANPCGANPCAVNPCNPCGAM